MNKVTADRLFAMIANEFHDAGQERGRRRKDAVGQAFEAMRRARDARQSAMVHQRINATVQAAFGTASAVTKELDVGGGVGEFVLDKLAGGAASVASWHEVDVEVSERAAALARALLQQRLRQAQRG